MHHGQIGNDQKRINRMKKKKGRMKNQSISALISL